MISLKPITNDNIWKIVKLTVDDGQKNFVATNVQSIAQAYVNQETARPFGIYDDETPVGFFMGAVNREAPEYSIWRFMIDKQYQGKGYGRAAITLAIDYLKEQGAKEIFLSYDPENAVAAKLYQSVGFVLTGEVDDGELVAKLVL